MKKIPIALASDNNLIFALATVIISALETKNQDTFYDFYVLCSKDVTAENKDKLKFIESSYSDCSINIIDMSGQFENVKKTHKYVTTPSLYKMALTSLLPELSKIIYLDTDVIVRADLSELYDFDLKDNYLAGVSAFINYFDHYERIKQQLDIPSLDSYINAGVLLMNLDAIRKDSIDKQWQNLIGAYHGSVDQHILNKVCYGKVSFLPCRFNVCQSCLSFLKDGKAAVFYPLKELKEAYENPTVFHWTGEKPWRFYDLFLAHEWLQYLLKTPFRNEIPSRKSINGINKKYKLFNKITLLKIKKGKYYLLGFLPIWKTKNKR
ncbi:glycosyltransferase family 8 protein [Desulfovibrio litoralis]|uniref:Lipopolysaccharide biosynthesis protein, LPS:glycosyltransferase n=1 Tax=Desulfovibrio litoralis DSM 11393 TaxID=1121455 RepID=A0A1M7T7E4_9BACT|nr:glycosyltransferase family 8 protein [Desulfovibrio litoralis]SHN66633.1 Lipopolysaccharide biosynthesis protein, LPS:glycosyltransferase [Desulfovibrio litoralis DSM 11393]